ncbi:MAG: HAMP domain-containing histidine kinase [Proteobacteria bacterium]|nr:sensor histidine kinase [Pseudomonadota bacterium]NOG59249.1 HAMP domain-containing histidine kinase [Pseudomonadota bacterium]
MINSASKFDYGTLIASSIHEVKNSLNMLLNSVDQVLTTTNQNDSNIKLFSQIQYEGKRVNDDLIGLLAIYRIENGQYYANIDEYSVHEFLEENISQHKIMLRHKHIEETLECDEELHWFFDCDLITGVISNVVNNLFKYTKDKLHVCAFREGDYLVIKVLDNGPGYPEEMLIFHDESDHQKNINFENANTGLGLYFSRLVAELHKNKGRNGYITTTNEGIDGGGCFSLYLP